MFHLCKFNYEYIAKAYKVTVRQYRYTIYKYDVYRCRVCGKLFFKDDDSIYIYGEKDLEKTISNLERCGYLEIEDIIAKQNYPDVEI